MTTEKDVAETAAAKIVPRFSKSLRTIRVAVPEEVHYDRSKMSEVLAKVLKNLGCMACHSGFDIRFVRETDFVVRGGPAMEFFDATGNILK